MSEVERYLGLGGMYQVDDGCGEGIYVSSTDFDAEHGLRLEAERQVGELREQLDKALLTKANKNWRDLNEIAADRDSALAKLDTAMGLLRRVGATTAMNYMVRQEWNAEFCDLADEFHTFLNSTSTEGRDHE